MGGRLAGAAVAGAKDKGAVRNAPDESLKQHAVPRSVAVPLDFIRVYPGKEVTMTFWKILGLAISLGLIALAAFLATAPWRVHGGRFITEYLLLAGTIGLVSLIILAVSLRYGN
jgi:hypothetical protein